MNNAPSDAHETETNLTGRQLGDYRLLRRLGRGGMAEVYLAEQCSLRRKIAFKVLRKQLADDDTYVRRFHREAQAVAALVHPNIVQIYEVGCIDGFHFIAQEYINGSTLKQIITRERTLDCNQVILIMRQVAAALHKAGVQGIVHRDIKPENILIDAHGAAKVVDFGLARVNRETAEMAMTQVGITMGTPLYMSPEQVEGKALDHRSDIYSLGVTSFHMLAGRPPFEGDTALSIAVQHMKKVPERLENLRKDAPEELCRMIHRMLEKDPVNRFADAGQLLRELRRLPVDDLGEEWAADLHDVSTTEEVTLSTRRIEATQQIESLMRQTPRHAAVWRSASTWAVLGIVCFAMGAGLAMSTQQNDPLALGSDEKLPTVEKLSSMEEQFNHARWVNTPKAWASVWELFPEQGKADQQLVLKAKGNLASLYLEEQDYVRALEQYQQMANAPPEETSIRLWGKAGKVVVAARDKNEDELNDSLGELFKQANEADVLREIPESLADALTTILEQRQETQRD